MITVARSVHQKEKRNSEIKNEIFASEAKQELKVSFIC